MSEISIADPRLKPASKGEIEQALRLLCNSMRAPEGGDFEALFRAYIVALDGCPAWAVANAVRRFVQGKVPDQSLVFCPYPPGLRQAVDREMAPVVRQVEAEMRQNKLKAEARAYRSTVQRTPEARQRVATAMEAYRESRRKLERKEQTSSKLDPELVAMVPDAPTTFERLRWLERGGDNGQA